VTTIFSSHPNQHPDSNYSFQIDMVEYVNEYTNNQCTLHTGSNGVCKMDPNVGARYKSLNGTTEKGFLGNPLSTECKSSNSNNNGCAFTDVQGSAGHPFNMASGGVFAMLWDNTQIAVWRFDRSEVPQDIQDENPNPETWGTPVAFWSNESCDIAASFSNLQRTFLTFPFFETRPND
jgi:hypothetical protein